MNYKLRPWNKSDAESLVKHANNFNIARYMKDVFPHPYSIDNANAFIEFATKDDPIHIFAIEVNGEAVGGIGIHFQTDIYRKNAELGYWLAEKYWGQGIVTGAIKEMIVFAFKNYDLQRLFASTFATNKASQRVLEKAGFFFEAKFEKSIFKNGEFEDEVFYSVNRENISNLQ